MDFIERCLGLSPDGGSGMLEAALILVVLALATLLARGPRLMMRRFF
jgi:hypothetical protein